ncbi:MAG: hypothetical protein FJX64_07995 [Alphaproteobacteria bacterium]|nr:hypothetical protein [Alphaproteobacteria bacterium]
MRALTVRDFLRCMAALAVGGLASPARAGHGDTEVPPSMRRFAGKVMALGAPDAKGDVYTFKATAQEEAVPPLIALRKADAIAKAEFVVAEVKSWRVTFLTGELLGAAYHVADNTANEVTVVDLYKHGPLNGLKVGDLFFVEEIYFQGRD